MKQIIDIGKTPEWRKKYTGKYTRIHIINAIREWIAEEAQTLPISQENDEERNVCLLIYRKNRKKEVENITNVPFVRKQIEKQRILISFV